MISVGCCVNTTDWTQVLSPPISLAFLHSVYTVDISFTSPTLFLPLYSPPLSFHLPNPTACHVHGEPLGLGSTLCNLRSQLADVSLEASTALHPTVLENLASRVMLNDLSTNVEIFVSDRIASAILAHDVDIQSSVGGRELKMVVRFLIFPLYCVYSCKPRLTQWRWSGRGESCGFICTAADFTQLHSLYHSVKLQLLDAISTLRIEAADEASQQVATLSTSVAAVSLAQVQVDTLQHGFLTTLSTTLSSALSVIDEQATTISSLSMQVSQLKDNVRKV